MNSKLVTHVFSSYFFQMADFDESCQRSKFKHKSDNYTIQKGDHIETVKLCNFQRQRLFVFKEIGVNIIRLLCANQETEFGRQAQAELETNRKTHKTRVHGLSQLVALAEDANLFSFDDNNIPYIVRDFEVSGVYVDHLWDALAFLGFAVSFFPNVHFMIVISLKKSVIFVCIKKFQNVYILKIFSLNSLRVKKGN